MKSLAILLVAAVAAVKPPDCVMPVVQKVVADLGLAFDLKALCSNQAFIDKLVPEARAACGDQFPQAVEAAKQICQTVGVDITPMLPKDPEQKTTPASPVQTSTQKPASTQKPTTPVTTPSHPSTNCPSSTPSAPTSTPCPPKSSTSAPSSTPCPPKSSPSTPSSTPCPPKSTTCHGCHTETPAPTEKPPVPVGSASFISITPKMIALVVVAALL